MGMYNPPSDAGSDEEVGMTTTVRNKVQNIGEKANRMGEKVSDKIDQAMGATALNLDKTSSKLSRAATYMREHNTNQVVADLGDVIRKKPIQSLVVGLVMGLFLGRLFK